MTEQAQEVTKLQEVPRDPQHCGQPMKKLLVGTTTGNPRYQYACLKCGAQQRGPDLNPPKQTTLPKEAVK